MEAIGRKLFTVAGDGLDDQGQLLQDRGCLVGVVHGRVDAWGAGGAGGRRGQAASVPGQQQRAGFGPAQGPRSVFLTRAVQTDKNIASHVRLGLCGDHVTPSLCIDDCFEDLASACGRLKVSVRVTVIASGSTLLSFILLFNNQACTQKSLNDLDVLIKTGTTCNIVVQGDAKSIILGSLQLRV